MSDAPLPARRGPLTAALLVLALLSPALAAGDTVTLEDLFGSGRWRLVSVTFGGTTTTLEPGAGAEFLVNEVGRLAGSVGCNQLIAAAELTPDGEARFEPIASTLMACPDPAMSRERAFVQALEAVERYEATEAQVRFTGPDVEVVFEPVAAPQG